MAPLTLLGVPSSAGAFAPGQELAPSALRAAGLEAALRARGMEVRDLGDSPVWRWRLDRDRPRAQNLGPVVDTVRATADRVRAALADGEPLLVLGGDCTIELGTVAGALDGDGRLGLLYFDLHPDLNVPDSVRTGTFDWMGMAHALAVAGAEPQLVEAGPRAPLLADDDLLFFAYGPEQTKRFEHEQMQARALAGVPVDEVAADPAGAARRALERLDRERVVVHFDVDTIDFNDAPLAENTGRGEGLTHDAALSALRVVLGDPRVVAVTVTELNPLHGDEEGRTLRRFVDALADSLAAQPALRVA